MGFINFMLKYLLMALFLFGCGDYRPLLGGFPTKNNYVNTPPPGSKAFQYGWMSGCYSGMNGQLPQFYTDLGYVYPHKDFKFAKDNPDYEVGWQVALWWCVRVGEKYEGLSKDKYGGII